MRSRRTRRSSGPASAGRSGPTVGRGFYAPPCRGRYHASDGDGDGSKLGVMVDSSSSVVDDPRRPSRADARYSYKAFLSYSHAADGRLASFLQAALQGFAKAWYRRRSIRVFRDTTGLEVTPDLWASISKALEASEHFILLA